ncbi:hypothetical protein HK102_012821 [Quaeritorhiza haematococci]|nr:hypothetical protein HK102_012821 [Quaeritorhiza haematococci]
MGEVVRGLVGWSAGGGAGHNLNASITIPTNAGKGAGSAETVMGKGEEHVREDDETIYELKWTWCSDETESGGGGYGVDADGYDDAVHPFDVVSFKDEGEGGSEQDEGDGGFLVKRRHTGGVDNKLKAMSRRSGRSANISSGGCKKFMVEVHLDRHAFLRNGRRCVVECFYDDGSRLKTPASVVDNAAAATSNIGAAGSAVTRLPSSDLDSRGAKKEEGGLPSGAAYLDPSLIECFVEENGGWVLRCYYPSGGLSTSHEQQQQPPTTFLPHHVTFVMKVWCLSLVDSASTSLCSDEITINGVRRRVVPHVLETTGSAGFGDVVGGGRDVFQSSVVGINPVLLNGFEPQEEMDKDEEEESSGSDGGGLFMVTGRRSRGPNQRSNVNSRKSSRSLRRRSGGDVSFNASNTADAGAGTGAGPVSATSSVVSTGSEGPSVSSADGSVLGRAAVKALSSVEEEMMSVMSGVSSDGGKMKGKSDVSGVQSTVQSRAGGNLNVDVGGKKGHQPSSQQQASQQLPLPLTKDRSHQLQLQLQQLLNPRIILPLYRHRYSREVTDAFRLLNSLLCPHPSHEGLTSPSLLPSVLQHSVDVSRNEEREDGWSVAHVGKDVVVYHRLLHEWEFGLKDSDDGDKRRFVYKAVGTFSANAVPSIWDIKAAVESAKWLPSLTQSGTDHGSATTSSNNGGASSRKMVQQLSPVSSLIQVKARLHPTATMPKKTSVRSTHGSDDEDGSRGTQFVATSLTSTHCIQHFGVSISDADSSAVAKTPLSSSSSSASSGVSAMKRLNPLSLFSFRTSTQLLLESEAQQQGSNLEGMGGLQMYGWNVEYISQSTGSSSSSTVGSEPSTPVLSPSVLGGGAASAGESSERYGSDTNLNRSMHSRVNSTGDPLAVRITYIMCCKAAPALASEDQMTPGVRAGEKQTGAAAATPQKQSSWVSSLTSSLHSPAVSSSSTPAAATPSVLTENATEPSSNKTLKIETAAAGDVRPSTAFVHGLVEAAEHAITSVVDHVKSRGAPPNVVKVEGRCVVKDVRHDEDSGVFELKYGLCARNALPIQVSKVDVDDGLERDGGAEFIPPRVGDGKLGDDVAGALEIRIDTSNRWSGGNAVITSALVEGPVKEQTSASASSVPPPREKILCVRDVRYGRGCFILRVETVEETGDDSASSRTASIRIVKQNSNTGIVVNGKNIYVLLARSGSVGLISEGGGYSLDSRSVSTLSLGLTDIKDNSVVGKDFSATNTDMAKSGAALSETEKRALVGTVAETSMLRLRQLYVDSVGGSSKQTQGTGSFASSGWEKEPWTVVSSSRSGLVICKKTIAFEAIPMSVSNGAKDTDDSKQSATIKCSAASSAISANTEIDRQKSSSQFPSSSSSWGFWNTAPVMYRACKVIDGVAPEEVHAVVTSAGVRKHWDDMVEDGQDVELYGNGMSVSYLILKGSFASNRKEILSVSMERTVHNPHSPLSPSTEAPLSSHHGSTFFVASSSIPDQFLSKNSLEEVHRMGIGKSYPGTKTRANVTIAGWVLEPLDPYDPEAGNHSIPSTKVTYFLQMDGGGNGSESGGGSGTGSGISSLYHSLFSNLPVKCVAGLDTFCRGNGHPPLVKVPSLPRLTFEPVGVALKAQQSSIEATSSLAKVVKTTFDHVADQYFIQFEFAVPINPPQPRAKRQQQFPLPTGVRAQVVGVDGNNKPAGDQDDAGGGRSLALELVVDLSRYRSGYQLLWRTEEKTTSKISKASDLVPTNHHDDAVSSTSSIDEGSTRDERGSGNNYPLSVEIYDIPPPRTKLRDIFVDATTGKQGSPRAHSSATSDITTKIASKSGKLSGSTDSGSSELDTLKHSIRIYLPDRVSSSAAATAIGNREYAVASVVLTRTDPKLLQSSKGKKNDNRSGALAQKSRGGPGNAGKSTWDNQILSQPVNSVVWVNGEPLRVRKEGLRSTATSHQLGTGPAEVLFQSGSALQETRQGKGAVGQKSRTDTPTKDETKNAQTIDKAKQIAVTTPSSIFALAAAASAAFTKPSLLKASSRSSSPTPAEDDKDEAAFDDASEKLFQPQQEKFMSSPDRPKESAYIQHNPDATSTTKIHSPSQRVGPSRLLFIPENPEPTYSLKTVHPTTVHPSDHATQLQPIAQQSWVENPDPTFPVSAIPTGETFSQGQDKERTEAKSDL